MKRFFQMKFEDASLSDSFTPDRYSNSSLDSRESKLWNLFPIPKIILPSYRLTFTRVVSMFTLKWYAE